MNAEQPQVAMNGEFSYLEHKSATSAKSLFCVTTNLCKQGVTGSFPAPSTEPVTHSFNCLPDAKAIQHYAVFFLRRSARKSFQRC